MNKGIIKIIMMLAAVAAMSGCSNVATKQPILSAAEVQSEIRVEVRVLAPVALDRAVASLAD